MIHPLKSFFKLIFNSCFYDEANRVHLHFHIVSLFSSIRNLAENLLRRKQMSKDPRIIVRRIKLVINIQKLSRSKQ